jgi:hypothetical protein
MFSCISRHEISMSSTVGTMVQIVNGTVLESYTIAKEEYGLGVVYVSALT